MENTQQQIDKLTQALKDLNDEIYRNNFSAKQDFTKDSNFTTRLKVPHYDVVPGVCETGEIIESAGKLYICSSTNLFTIVGSQT